MTKQMLVNYIAEETGLTKADATRALDAMMSGIVEGLKSEGKVALTGSFVTVGILFPPFPLYFYSFTRC